jgi:predicted RNase H-like HicB family nuclease
MESPDTSALWAWARVSAGRRVPADGPVALGPEGYPRHMPMSRSFTAAVHREEDWYVAQCLEVDVASQGPTIDEALANLAEAVELYLEEVDDPARFVTSTPLVTSFQVPGAA